MHLKFRWSNEGLTVLTVAIAFLIAYLVRDAIGFSWPWLALIIMFSVTAIRAAWAITRYGFLGAISR